MTVIRDGGAGIGGVCLHRSIQSGLEPFNLTGDTFRRIAVSIIVVCRTGHPDRRQVFLRLDAEMTQGACLKANFQAVVVMAVYAGVDAQSSRRQGTGRTCRD